MSPAPASTAGQAGSRANLWRMVPGIRDVPIIGILRGFTPSTVPATVAAAFDAGLKVVEVTFDSEEPCAQISQIKTRLPTMSVGAGSVLNPAQVDLAARAGACFVVSPVTDISVITACLDAGMAVIPGASSPTEVHLAASTGATAVKIFPASLLGGPAYLSAISSPLGSPCLVPTGGVTLENVSEYLGVGAVAVGAGSALFGRTGLSHDPRSVSDTVRRWVDAVTR